MKSEQLQLIEAQLRAQPFSTDMSVADMRSAYDAMGGMFPLPEGLRTEQVTANGVPCVRFKALSAAEDRTILYLHGGGYVIGSTTSHGWLCAKLSEAAGITVDRHEPRPAEPEVQAVQQRAVVEHRDRLGPLRALVEDVNRVEDPERVERAEQQRIGKARAHRAPQHF